MKWINHGNRKHIHLFSQRFVSAYAWKGNFWTLRIHLINWTIRRYKSLLEICTRVLFVYKGGVPLEHFKGGWGFAVTVFNRLGVFFAHNSIFAHIFRICHRRIDPTSFWPPFDLHDLQNHKCFLGPLKSSILGWFGMIEHSNVTK